jgi:nitrate reductase assembly molybdenum cofactor insertion protein NarJ
MHSAAPQSARRALAEMADVLSVLAGRLDKRAGVRSEA